MAWLLLTGAAWAQADESCFTNKANAERAAAGLPALSVNSQLVDVARRHSQEMAASQTIFHNPGLAGEVTGRWLLLGENVGTGPSCDDVHEALMKSPLHRKNILEPKFNAVGMGTVVDGGAIYLTQVFMQAGGGPAPPAPRAAPAPPPAPKPAPPPAPKPAPPPAAPKPKPASSPKPKPPPAPKPSVAPPPPPSPMPPPPPVPAPPPPSPTLPAPLPSVSVQGTVTARSPSPGSGGGGGPAGMLLAVGGVVVAGAGIGLLVYRLARKRR
ncbi:MAG TPA: CAP domain-containing protein [Actinomycetota bacterium]|jgi:hypothetical protein